MKAYKLLDTIIATVNIPDHKVLAGDIGAIVEVYTTPLWLTRWNLSTPMARLALCSLSRLIRSALWHQPTYSLLVSCLWQSNLSP